MARKPPSEWPVTGKCCGSTPPAIHCCTLSRSVWYWPWFLVEPRVSTSTTSVMTSWMSLVPRIARTRSPVATFWKTVAERPLLSE
ncbi:MAG: hypothetical protein IPF73_05940 [Betaproteobacteria bacterium]|nr:hypothetical protein [Betaproteobacteria bacterium]